MPHCARSADGPGCHLESQEAWLPTSFNHILRPSLPIPFLTQISSWPPLTHLLLACCHFLRRPGLELQLMALSWGCLGWRYSGPLAYLKLQLPSALYVTGNCYQEFSWKSVPFYLTSGFSSQGGTFEASSPHQISPTAVPGAGHKQTSVGPTPALPNPGLSTWSCGPLTQHLVPFDDWQPASILLGGNYLQKVWQGLKEARDPHSPYILSLNASFCCDFSIS